MFAICALFCRVDVFPKSYVEKKMIYIEQISFLVGKFPYVRESSRGFF